MFNWQSTTNHGEKSFSGLPGRQPLIHPDLQNNIPTKNKALGLFMLGFIILAPLLITFANLSQNSLP
jgi:hypothetical protein